MQSNTWKPLVAQPAEWGTFALIVLCYGLWLPTVVYLAAWSTLLSIVATALLVAFHSSLTHEVLHGHPFRSRRLNETLIFLPLNLMIPYYRFRDLHLAHHRDSNLTDPYDDPETNFVDPAVWSRFPHSVRWVFLFNNTMMGRMLVGVAIGQLLFFRDELCAALRGDRQIWLAWSLHVLGVVIILWIVTAAPMPVWAYLLSAYVGLSIIKIRTFLEHRAHEKTRARTVIIEDRGPLAFMFLSNNLHVVHHMNPTAAWYDLPDIYNRAKARYRGVNDTYVYRSYGEIFRKYFFRSKDPVPHPLWPTS